MSDKHMNYADIKVCGKRRQLVEESEDERKLPHLRKPHLKKRCIQQKVRFDVCTSDNEKIQSVRDFMLALRLTNKGVHESAKTEKAAEKRRERKRQINRQSALRKRIREKDTLVELEDKNKDLLAKNKTLKTEQQELAFMIQQVKQALASKSRDQSKASAVTVSPRGKSYSPPMNLKVSTTQDLKTLQFVSMQKQLQALQHSIRYPLSVGHASVSVPHMILPSQENRLSLPPASGIQNQNNNCRSIISQQIHMAIEAAAKERALEMLSSSERALPSTVGSNHFFQTFEQPPTQPTHQQLLSQLFTSLSECNAINNHNNNNNNLNQLNTLFSRQQIPQTPQKIDVTAQLIVALLASVR